MCQLQTIHTKMPMMTLLDPNVRQARSQKCQFPHWISLKFWSSLELILEITRVSIRCHHSRELQVTPWLIVCFHQQWATHSISLWMPSRLPCSQTMPSLQTTSSCPSLPTEHHNCSKRAQVAHQLASMLEIPRKSVKLSVFVRLNPCLMTSTVVLH